MEKDTNQYEFEAFFLPLFFCFLLINTIVRSKYEALYPLGDFTTTMSIVGMCLIMLKSYGDRVTYRVSLRPVQLSIGLLMMVYVASYFTYHEIDLLLFIRLMLFFLFILGSIRLKWNARTLTMAGYIFSSAIVLIFVHWGLSGFPFSGYKAIFLNENYLGVLLFCFLYFNVLSLTYTKGRQRLYFLGIFLLNLILIYPTSARSVLIAIAVILFSWVVLQSFRPYFRKLFYLVIVGNFLFVIGYVGLSYTNLGNRLNELSYSLTGKNLFSGRHEIWDNIMQGLVDKPFFGFGVGLNAQDMSEATSVAHNMYLQVLIETGLVGLLVFIFVLWTVWHLLNRRLNSAAAKWSACFMLGILVYNEFEFTLMNNNYSIAILQWLIMTIGISFVPKIEKEQPIG